MKAKTIKGKSTSEIRDALAEAMSDGFAPTLAFVFLSIQMDRKTICEVINKANIQIFGATTEGGEFMNAEVDKYSISILLLDIKPEYFKVIFQTVENGEYREATRALANKSLEYYQNPALIFSGSGVWDDPYIEKLVDGFKDILGNEAPVFGGMAGDDLNLKDSFVFTNGQTSNHGTIVVAFNSDLISVKGVTSCAWNSIGTTKTITESSENTVYSINGEPALELVMRYAGIKELPDNLYDIQTELNHSLQIQLQKEKGEHIMRAGVVNMEDRSLFFMGSMPEGAKIKFCLLPDLDTIDELVKVVQRLKNSEAPEADAVLLFDCVGRQIAFGPEISREIDGVYNIWKSPMAGCFSQGEFGKATGGDLELHNLSSVCVALKEK